MKQNSNKLLSSLALMFLLPLNSQADSPESSSSSTELSVDDETVKLALKVNRKLIESDLVEAKDLPDIDVLDLQAYQSYLEYYFQEYLPVTKNEGEPVNLSIKSADLVDSDTVVFNFEAPLEDADLLSINNRVLFDTNDEQVNKVKVAENSYTFTNAVDEPLIVWQKGHGDSLV
ncbi:hypothetical protein N7931_04535 [Catenovulum sp. 2E275]|uniref:DUF6702 family protein n=1 Tax=Catenovulum sp. 2E275 TaxID=2980497 RepID=UPI0021D069E7|nr:DUF6702 family protein [Catenovulum sp. 2E275]MCU4674894.1 hypothetical protein [Catenovulum sp. 2E275]